MAAVSGWLLNNLSSTYKYVTGYNLCSIGFLQLRNYAARKGTREKARKKKVKVVIEKVGFIPHKKRNLKSGAKKKNAAIKDVILNDSKGDDPVDNVWIGSFHKWKVYSFEEAVQSHRETHHPTIYNLPDSSIKALVELDMHGTKKTKVVDTFTRIVSVPYPFDHGERRKILAFGKTSEMQNIAINAGAEFAGGKELVKHIQKGTFSIKDYDIIISEPTILPDLLLIRGLMRKKFPNVKLGTLHPDLDMLTKKFLTGIKYTALPHELDNTYGTIEVAFGKLNMETKQLEENFAAVLNDIYNAKPRREGPFITRTRLTCQPSPELFKIEFEQYLPKVRVEEEQETEEDEALQKEDAIIASH